VLAGTPASTAGVIGAALGCLTRAGGWDSGGSAGVVVAAIRVVVLLGPGPCPAGSRGDGTYPRVGSTALGAIGRRTVMLTGAGDDGAAPGYAAVPHPAIAAARSGVVMTLAA